MNALAGGPLAVPSEDCVGPHPEAHAEEPVAAAPQECPTCLGASMPNWRLYDFQPISCGFGQHYGLDQFVGRPTLVVMLSASCGYCLGQASKLEELQLELQAAGVETHFAVVNSAGTEDRQQSLADRVSFPLFQDTQDRFGWGAFNGEKDDFFIYDATGRLAAYYPSHGTVETTLSIEEGYGNLRDALLHVSGRADVALPADGNGGAVEGEQ